MDLLVSMRAEIAPKPGFVRQLQALDASLQRVVRSSMRGAGDAALRRFAEWEPALLAPAGAPVLVTDPLLEEELVLHHTYANGRNVDEEVILAARSATPIARESCARRGAFARARAHARTAPRRDCRHCHRARARALSSCPQAPSCRSRTSTALSTFIRRRRRRRRRRRDMARAARWLLPRAAAAAAA